ncbi:MAG: flagellar basal body-associated FliL family protein [Campylobacter sp.]|uniref:flagellar basal body-associated FliL family protein n=1 Tax=Campylobacter sp. TaxID=205 RepID=UPI00297383D2|nr:flagellar basal body-associated FliL family protein [Campylobacter sp.]MCI7237136.1 flagellar basal body-associated FliL family protein [Campylobacter sp.]MDD7600198.1 flagellar basal body-associated FliL family protein [Campylobacteraceae bacterium]MDY5887616.1 flagellar basal body-associated FliL family protein [Campylobacter sp.]
MKKIFLVFFLLGILEFHALFGADFEIKNLEVDLYSKTSSEMKKISMDLHIFTSEVAKSSAIKDAINVIVSSFYAQDLMSSKGKEAFKEAIKKYSASKYKIKIDDVYILSLKEIDNIDIKRLVKQLDKYYKNSANKESNSRIPSSQDEIKTDFGEQDFGTSNEALSVDAKIEEQKKQANELIERQMKASRDMLDGIKDFGDVDFYR